MYMLLLILILIISLESIRICEWQLGQLLINTKAACKRTQRCWPTTPNIVGCYILLNKLYSTNKFVSRWSPPLCNDHFLAGCTFSHNWIHPLKNATVEMNQRNLLPISITRFLVALANVIQSPHLNNKSSVILLNHGLHFITSTNFST